MKTVNDILKMKGSRVITVDSDAIVVNALVLMAENNIGAVLVTDKSGRISGIFSERDFVRKIIVKGRNSETARVAELMTADPIAVDPEASLGECMNLMTDHKFRHLPVMKNGQLIGIISIGDVVKALIDDQDKIISEQAFELGQLERTNMGAI
ncbi:MAG: CBS domain-containing protein [Candidatus Hydrogenedentales bacterium]